MISPVKRLLAVALMLQPPSYRNDDVSFLSSNGSDDGGYSSTDDASVSDIVSSVAPMAIPEALQKCQIYQWLRSGEFWHKDYLNDILPQIKIEFESELEHLKTAKADRKGVGNGREDTFAMLLYGGLDGTFVDEDGVTRDKATTYYEIDRTLTAVRALLWIGNDQVEIFNPHLARAEAEAKQQSTTDVARPWTWIRQRFMTPEANVFSPECAHICYGLITSVIINDIGKDQNIARAYERHTGHPLRAANHDAYLQMCADAGMVPSIDRLPSPLRRSIMLGIEVAAECNLGQMAQAESPPAAMYPLVRFRNDTLAWRLRFMEQILDLAGAKGHINNQLALVFVPPVAQGNRNCYQAAEEVIEGVTPRMAYNRYLQTRYEYLVNAHGYTRQLSVHNHGDRALMRIFCLSGCTSKSMAELFDEVLFHHPATDSFRHELILALSEDGITRPAVQVTYLPALIDGVMKSDWENTNEKKRGLAAALQYVTRCLYISEADRLAWHRKGVTVLERDVFEAMQWVKLGSGGYTSYRSDVSFIQDPSQLARFKIPELVVVNKIERGFENDFR